ncbi:DUF1080 domain-containing protein [Panacibacter ginsenosidivorans]|uniref:DUF1080 domain-containing protein n=1 Tax=Panacibacter ginsenosidivorans TaxID=1813871 RepID=A0A5B8VDF8_9BACT|nr:DUF1080 domain-containing protein [Panacibacter ginsenosidivorans]QEC69504.1 DUF1080 domain-containing protein [Panacibacter ginsenosidivorans]
MKKIAVISVLIFCGLTTTLNAQKGWIKMFNGKDLSDWIIKIKDHPLNENYGNTFRVENGVMKVSYDQYNNQFKEQFGHIFYKQKFSAYLLYIEYRFTGDQIKDGPDWAYRNSGAMLHCQDPKSMMVEQDFPISLEMQLLGGNGKDERSTCNLCTPGTNVILDGKFFTPHCVNSTSKTFHGDQWVVAQALVLGDSIIKHIVGSDTVLMYTKPQYDGRDKWVQKKGFKDGALISEGYISLQSESHPVEFRKVELFDLSPYMNDPKKLQEILMQLQQVRH